MPSRKWDTRPGIRSVLAKDTAVNTAKEHSGVQSQGTVITGTTNRKLACNQNIALRQARQQHRRHDVENNQQHAVTSSKDAIKWTTTYSTKWQLEVNLCLHVLCNLLDYYYCYYCANSTGRNFIIYTI
jgi:hypothetical protein